MVDRGFSWGELVQLSKDRLAETTRKGYERRLTELRDLGWGVDPGVEPPWGDTVAVLGSAFAAGACRDPMEYVRAVRFYYRSQAWRWPEAEGQVLADASKALRKKRKKEDWELGKQKFQGLKKGLEVSMLETWNPEGSARTRIAKRAIALLTWRLLMRGKGVSELLVNQIRVTEEKVEVMKVFHKTTSRGAGAKKSVFSRRNVEEGLRVGEALEKWLELREILVQEEKLEGNRLFAWPVEKKKGRVEWHTLKSEGVARVAKEIARQATGSDSGYAAHAFRRGAARTLYNAGTPLDRIMLEGGWSSVQALAFYIQIPLLQEQAKSLTSSQK